MESGSSFWGDWTIANIPSGGLTMHVRISHLLAGWLATVALIASVAAHANIVTNGGFETGNLAGWTQFGDTSFTGVDNQSPQSGVFAAFAGPSAPGGIFQTLATTPGRSYTVDFWLMNEADVLGQVTPNAFAFSWGGAPKLTLTNAAASGYTHYSFILLATSASTDLRFTFQHGPAFWDLDTVSAVVPEPGTLALVALAGLAALARRRRTV